MRSCWGRAGPRTAAEVAANVTPENESYPPLDVRRYGADGSGA